MTAIVAVVVAAVAMQRWLHNRPPYEMEAIQAAATVQMMSHPGKNVLLEPGVFNVTANEGSSLVKGVVTWKSPPVDDGQYVIVVIDKRVRLKPPLINARLANGGVYNQRGIGGGVLEDAADKYPWLQGAGDISTGWNTSTSGGDELSRIPPAANGVTFIAEFPLMRTEHERKHLASGPISLPDVLVGLIYVGPGDQIFWAQRLFG